MENVEDYEPGGFMPVTQWQGIGPNNRFKIIRKLGFGTYSTVWMCKDEAKQDDTYYALKILKAAYFAKASALREIRILNHIRTKDSSHIGQNRFVSYYGYFTKRSINGKHHCLLNEIMGKSLFDLIGDDQALDPEGVKLIVKQILEGLNFLHTKCNIIHADLKLENILVCAEEPYFHSMASYVRQFNELGVAMPRSYLTSIEWEEYNDTHNEKNISMKQSNCSLQDASFYKPPNHIEDSLMFVNPNMQIKISDLGCGIYEVKHYLEI
ncbi:hypothetical protein ILUMI_21776 [Ignelater luminosus]|uniref:non-specific serine/threonine protein kinase n=1 Tax=Ignelater luminosus TaxID=2038154 RepID=A0A8K0G143_IGNLU|nr:hypothetical protein ILUMI_21776 [Ignelater luminosus]